MSSAADASPPPTLHTIGQIVQLMQTNGPLFLHAPDPETVSGSDGDFRDPESYYRFPGTPGWGLQPESWWLDSTATWVARRLARNALRRATAPPTTVIAGEIVSWGIDGQPLIANARTMAIVDADVFVEAQATYTSWREAVLPRR